MLRSKQKIVFAVWCTAGIAFLLLFFAYARAETPKPDNFLQYGCTVDCMGETCALVQEVSGSSATQCIKEAKNKTYEESTQCISRCAEKPTVGAKVKAESARDNCGEAVKALHSINYLGEEHCKPFRSGKKVDFLTLRVNQNLSGGERRCPVGTNPSDDGFGCGPCPEGSELDNLHTVCLNRKEITKHIKFLYSLFPDDIQNAISKKIGEEVKKRLGNNEIGALLGDVAENAINGEIIADFVYTNYIHNTLNLRRLIQRVGSDEGAKIFLKLFEAAKNREAKTAPKDEKKPETQTPKSTPRQTPGTGPASPQQAGSTGRVCTSDDQCPKGYTCRDPGDTFFYLKSVVQGSKRCIPTGDYIGSFVNPASCNREFHGDAPGLGYRDLAASPCGKGDVCITAPGNTYDSAFGVCVAQ